MGRSRKKKDRLQYPCIPLVIHPIFELADMPIFDPAKKYEIVKDYAEEEESIRPGTSNDSDFKAEDLDEPHRLNELKLSDLIRYLDLPKTKPKCLASRLQIT
ncbi:hypothetical protein TNCV_2268921 [Trichonephila clavipes]|nr:hypothetical protein TNCV_2268921 [Trichonephila clavipes]